MKHVNLYLRGESEEAFNTLKNLGFNIQVILRTFLTNKATEEDLKLTKENE